MPINRNNHTNTTISIIFSAWILLILTIAFFVEKDINIYTMIEALVLLGAGITAFSNYDKTIRDIGEVTVSAVEAQKLIVPLKRHMYVFAVLYLGTCFVGLVVQQPHFFAGLVACIYGLYCRTNFLICQFARDIFTDPHVPIARRQSALLSQHYYFLSEENWIAFVTYTCVALLAVIMENVAQLNVSASIFGFISQGLARFFQTNIHVSQFFPASQLKGFVAGAAMIHLTMSAVRYRSIVANTTNQDIFEFLFLRITRVANIRSDLIKHVSTTIERFKSRGTIILIISFVLTYMTLCFVHFLFK